MSTTYTSAAERRRPDPRRAEAPPWLDFSPDLGQGRHLLHGQLD